MIGLLGGTFDPIHYGHLRPAAEVRHALGFAELRLVPTARPPHRQPPVASFEHRLRMVGLAIAQSPGFVVDDREHRMPGPSYTVRTLESLRAELGAVPLCLLMGTDAFRGLTTWYQWERLFELAHIVVMERPGSPLSVLASGLPPWAQPRLCRERERLARAAGGLIVLQPVQPQEVSASAIRAMIAAGRTPQGLLPDAVWNYIQVNRLYGYRSQGA